MKQQACTTHCCMKEQTGLSRWLAQTAAILTSAHVGMSRSGFVLGIQALVVTTSGTYCLILESLAVP